jgi:hypothetical protein
MAVIAETRKYILGNGSLKQLDGNADKNGLLFKECWWRRCVLSILVGLYGIILCLIEDATDSALK